MRALAVGALASILSLVGLTGCNVHECSASSGTHSAYTYCMALRGDVQRVVAVWADGTVVTGNYVSGDGRLSVVAFPPSKVGIRPVQVYADVR